MRPTDAQLRGFLAGILAPDEAEQVARWVESTPDAADVLARLNAPDSLAAALAGTPGGQSTTDATRATDTRPRAEPSAPAAPPVLPVLPGYRITGEIARGGMGRVYAAVDLILGREVAIKTLLPGVNAERFVTESKITARLPHPGIPPVHALGHLPDGTPFLAMKLIRGRTLAELLASRERERPEVGKWVGVFEQIAQAVGFAHSRGVIHRDLKPLNVMVGEFGEVQVMDWGLARATADPGPSAVQDSTAHPPPSALTQAGTVMGTPAYMAPEQARGEPVDARADVFALGSILAVILTGHPAFVGGTGREIVGRAAAGDLSGAFDRLAGCGADADLVAVCKRCLCADPQDRPADGRAVAELVRAYRTGVEARLRRAETEAAEASVRDAEGRKRRRVWRWATTAVIGVLVAGTAVSVAFGVEATRQADRANTKQKEAEDKAEEISRKSEEITSLNTDLTASNRLVVSKNEEYQKALARSSLSPLAVGNYYDPLNEYERAALWNLAALRDGPVGLLCLKEASSSPLTAKQLTRRADLLHHAAVGLDSRRRAEVDGLFAARLKDPALSAETKLDVAVAAAGRCPSAASDITDRLLAGLLTDKPRTGLLATALAAVADDLPADRAAAVRLTTANALLTMPVGDADPWLALERESLLATAVRTLPAETAVTFLSTQLGKPASQSNHAMMADALVALAPDLSPQVCETAAAALLAQMGNKEIFVKTPHIDALAAVCRRLPPERAGELLLGASGKLEVYVHHYKPPLACKIATTAALWPADTAAEVCGKVADDLKKCLRQAYDHMVYYDLGVALVMLAERQPADKAADTRKAGVTVFEAPRLVPRNGLEWATLSGRLVQACRYLPADTTEALCESVADAVQVALRSTTDVMERAWLSGALSDTSCGLPPDKAVPLVEKATTAMLAAVKSDKLDTRFKGEAALLLVNAVGRLPTAQAADVCGRATDALRPSLLPGKVADYSRVWVDLRVAAMSHWLPAERAVGVLLPMMANTDQGWERPGVAQALAFAARRLPEDRAVEVCLATADALLGESLSPTALDVRTQRRDALAALALQLGQVDSDRRRLVPAVAGGWAFATPQLPTPRPLPPEKLVELLKHPFCVKEARRAVLDALEVTYGRKFADLWAFVAFAETEHPELDLLTPPRRPDKK